MGFRNIHLEGLHGRFDASTRLSDLRLNDPRGDGEVDKKVIFFVLTLCVLTYYRDYDGVLMEFLSNFAA